MLFGGLRAGGATLVAAALTDVNLLTVAEVALAAGAFFEVVRLAHKFIIHHSSF
jgi:hypothetical protein